MAERNPPQPMDAARMDRLYDEYITRVYVSDAKPEESSVLRLLFHDLKMEVVGEAADWFTTLAQVPLSQADILLVDWDVLPVNSPDTALGELRKACPSLLVVLLISHLDSQTQAALSIDVDMFIRKDEPSKIIAKHLQEVAARIPT